VALKSLPALGVTGITGLAVVGITRNVSMFVVHPRFIMGVAVDARKIVIVSRNMAVRAIPLRMFSGFYGKRVIEFRLRPEHMGGIVTEFTICGEAGRFVIWILSGIIILYVAVHAFFGWI
jgi:hypothetical protein